MSDAPPTEILPATPAGHLLGPAAVIGVLSLLLAAGLTALGITAHIDAMIASKLAITQTEPLTQQLSPWAQWLATATFAFGTAVAILGTTGTWRRAALWFTIFFLECTWAPVLTLAAHAPTVAAPMVATLWSGICAIVHAAHHHAPTPTPPPESHESC